jgi:hypothetical protein
MEKVTIDQLATVNNEIFQRWIKELNEKGFCPVLVLAAGVGTVNKGQVYVIANGHATEQEVRALLDNVTKAMPGKAGGIEIVNDMSQVNELLRKPYGKA